MKTMKYLQKEIFNTYQNYKKYENLREHYELYIQLLLQNENKEVIDNYLTYWEVLKENDSTI